MESLTCLNCRANDVEVVRSDRHGFVVLCNECGFARGATLQHSIAS